MLSEFILKAQNLQTQVYPHSHKGLIPQPYHLHFHHTHLCQVVDEENERGEEAGWTTDNDYYRYGDE
jgi:hypothetical protein